MPSLSSWSAKRLPMNLIMGYVTITVGTVRIIFGIQMYRKTSVMLADVKNVYAHAIIQHETTVETDVKKNAPTKDTAIF